MWSNLWNELRNMSELKKDLNKNGYIIIKSLLNKDEVNKAMNNTYANIKLVLDEYYKNEI